jgi:hypothetical protein
MMLGCQSAASDSFRDLFGPFEAIARCGPPTRGLDVGIEAKDRDFMLRARCEGDRERSAVRLFAVADSP